jgi:sugar-specific transcriptional regulator TrmB
MQDIADPLVSLGFTQLEADVYAWLLAVEPSSGYRIAQALRKPAPNIYKAIESLEAKGAVMVDEGQTRRCRPVPPDELLAHLDRRFQSQRHRAERALRRLHRREEDHRVYRMRSPSAVLERCRAMIARAQEIVLVDAFPAPLAEIADALSEAAARGVRVAVLTYAEHEIDGVFVVVDAKGENVRRRWSGHWLNVVVDGAEHLVSLMDADRTSVRQAVWSGSVYLSWVYHSAVASEIALAALESESASITSAAGFRARIDELNTIHSLDAPGYRELEEATGE